MKAIRLITMIVVLLLSYSSVILAQTTQTKLNQVELFKQWIGYWKAEIGKDTTFIIDCKSFYNGFEFYLKVETKGKIMFEQKTLMGYDKKNDKLIECAINNSSKDIMLYALWYTSTDKCEEILLDDIANPEKASIKYEGEFKTPDLLIWKEVVNDKTTWMYTLHREK